MEKIKFAETLAIISNGGEVKTVWEKDNERIDRWLFSHAYPRNGNFHNPTPEYRWIAYRNGVCVGTERRLREAKELLKIGD